MSRIHARIVAFGVAGVLAAVIASSAFAGAQPGVKFVKPTPA